MKRAAIYSRVSTLKEEQTNALGASLERLREYATRRGFEVREFTDRLTGKRTDRPGYVAMLEAARRREVDVIVVTRLDRLGRSTVEIIRVGRELEALGVDLVAVDQPIDTTTPMGRFLFVVFAALAELERDFTRDRILRGMETARKRGRVFGRPQAHVDLVPKVRTLRAIGMSYQTIVIALQREHAVTVTRSWVVRACTGSTDGVRVAETEATLTTGNGVSNPPVFDTLGGPTP